MAIKSASSYLFKLVISFFLAVPFCTSNAATWLPQEGIASQDSFYYYDIESVEGDKNMMSIWIKEINPKKKSHSLIRVYFYCKQYSYSMTDRVDYLDGKPIDSWSDSNIYPKRKPIIPETVFEEIFNQACYMVG